MLRVLLQRRIVAQNIKRLKDIGCYRGRRHIMVRRLLSDQPFDTLLRCQQPRAANACSSRTLFWQYVLLSADYHLAGLGYEACVAGRQCCALFIICS
jgi:hypothetical protein